MLDFKSPGKEIKKAIKFIGGIPGHLQEGNSRFQYLEAVRLLHIVKEHIRNQDLPWTELSERYMKRKAAVGLDPRIYVATKELFSKLQVVEHEGNYYIGAPQGTVHKASGLELNKLLTILESGSILANIPPRPLVQPSREEASEGQLQRWLLFQIDWLKKRYPKD
jgi:hypothetical protein